jgi:serine/threonine-protein kinase
VADARSDVFALGALAYRLLTGEKPFRGVTRETIAMDVLQWDPPSPRAVRPEVPDHVSAAVMKALAKSPAERSAGAAAFLGELRGAGGAVPAASPPPARTTVPPSLVRTDAPPTATVDAAAVPPRGRPRALIAALIVLAFGAGIGAVWLLRNRPWSPAAAVAPAAARPGPIAPSTVPSRPAVRQAPPARAPAPAPASDPTADQVRDVLEKVWEEARKQTEPPPSAPAQKSRGKGHGKGKKH